MYFRRIMENSWVDLINYQIPTLLIELRAEK